MSNETLSKLIECCKNELQITWDDADTDKRILNHIKNGAVLLERVCGATENDFNEGGKANALLLSYVRRAFSGDVSSFEDDYRSDIMGLLNDKEVEEYAK